MKRRPTDKRILEAIYALYQAEYRRRNSENPTTNYIGIDIGAVADKLGMDPDILFGRLHYDLDRRYRYKQETGAYVHFFSLVVGEHEKQ